MSGLLKYIIVHWEIFKYNKFCCFADNNYLPEIFNYAVVNTHGSLVDPQKLPFDKRYPWNP